MRLQRTKQTAVTSAGINANTRLCQADESRIYVGFFIPAGGNTYLINTTPIVSPGNPGITMPTATAIPCLEYFRDRHGLFSQLEWWGQTNAALGSVFSIVLELFEWDSPEYTSPGGVLLGTAGGLLDPLQGGEDSRSKRLRNAILAAQRTYQHGQG